MMMKIKILEKGPMILTGKKVLKAIMDNYTPPVDLFVREVIQNSADAVLKDKDYVRIKFDIGEFDNYQLANVVETIKYNLLKENTQTRYKFIAISDSNTSGLLGEPEKNENGGYNNLYNLVYDFMNDKDDDVAGGSCGIGKSVYYRYGNGICFYYSRTYENNQYISKLAGALIQDESKDDCFLGKNSSGIAYFGNVLNNKAIPIYDETEIKEFLEIFGIEPYRDNKTGTIVIIPYFNERQLLESYNTSEDNVNKYWLQNIESCLDMSIQRWYFPRINNENYNGKYIKVAVNNSKVELCQFFDKLQKLYNNQIDGQTSFKVTGRGFDSNEILGTLNYKLFSREELGILVPPTNYPEPRFFVDSSNDCDREGLLFYTRKPGMILNYHNKDFGTFSIEDNKYLIGVFVLNDELITNGESLGQYMRRTEKSNHNSWNVDKIEDFPYLSKKRPYSKLSATIRNHLNEVFKHNKAVSLDGDVSIIQRKLGQKLLPPLDFGNDPSVDPVKPPRPVTPRRNKVSISANGLNENGNLSYSIEFFIEKNERMLFAIEIKAGIKRVSFKGWEELGFAFPCSLESINIEDCTIEQGKTSYPQMIPIDVEFKKRRKKVVEGTEIYKVKGITTPNDVPCGFITYNAIGKRLKFKVNVEIKPIDNKYSLGLNAVVDKEVSNE